jgi:uncharacterized protein (DUF433 family)
MPEIGQAPKKAQPLFRVIVEAIRDGRIHEGEPSTFLSYSEALALLGSRAPSYRSGSRLQKAGLSALNEWTMRHSELPQVAALIVNKKTRRPSIGFARSHGREDDPNWEQWWMAEANKAITFDWSPHLEPITRYRRGVEESGSGDGERLLVKEEEDYAQRIERVPAPARVRGSGIKVSDILTWLAAGQTDAEIILRHPGLSVGDIRASLAYAAAKEKRQRQPIFATRWAGKLRLPPTDLSDSRLTYLLDRYLKER